MSDVQNFLIGGILFGSKGHPCVIKSSIIF
jgi:hypothetical protein